MWWIIIGVMFVVFSMGCNKTYTSGTWENELDNLFEKHNK